MDDSAIKRIQDTHAAVLNPPGLADVDAIALPDTAKLHDLEDWRLCRRRFRGTMSTDVPASYIEYIETHLVEGGSPTCFIDPNHMAAITAFNLGTQAKPGHGDDLAELRLAETSAFSALREANGEPMPQREMCEWLEDWHQYLRPISESQHDLTLPKAIATLRNLTFEERKEDEHNVENFSARRSSIESIEARSKVENMPSGFLFFCVPYKGLSQFEFSMRVSILRGERVRLVLRIQRFEEARERIAEAFRDLLQPQLDLLSIPAFIGTFKVGC